MLCITPMLVLIISWKLQELKKSYSRDIFQGIVLSLYLFFTFIYVLSMQESLFDRLLMQVSIVFPPQKNCLRSFLLRSESRSCCVQQQVYAEQLHTFKIGFCDMVQMISADLTARDLFTYSYSVALSFRVINT